MRRRRSAVGGWRRRIIATAIVGGATLAALVGPGMALARVYSVPPPAQPLPADTMIFASGGTLLADLHPSGTSRIPVPLSQVSPLFLKAVVAIEDHSFWTSGSIDPGRILISALHDIIHHSTSQGASTIPEQLAKILYLQDNKTIAYKLREILLGNTLESEESKRQILDQYVNDVYFGQGATGIQSAALTYFGVAASQLTFSEATLLAGLLPAPSAYDPFVSMSAARDRQQLVVAAMEAQHELTAAQGQAVLAAPIHLAATPATAVNRAPYFVGYVEDWLSRHFGPGFASAGLRVTTTLNYHLEEVAQRMVNQIVQQRAAMHMTDGALVSLDPQTGAIEALVGGAGPKAPGGQIDMATVPRQPGSTFKLFTYSAALASRTVTMTTPVLDSPLTLQTPSGPFVIHDYEGVYAGVVPVQVALGNSLNVPAVRVELKVGVPKVVATARAFGVTTLTRPAADYGPSLTLGAYPVPLVQMAQAGSVLAAQGTLHPAHAVTRVTTASGRVRYQAQQPARQVVSPAVAYIMNTILSRDSNRLIAFGPGSDLVIPGHQVAVKTGTSNSFRDNLAVGWTPTLLTATWVGNASDAPMYGGGINGISGAAPLWHDYMSFVLGSTPSPWYPMPTGLYQGPAYGAQPVYYLTGTGPGTGVLGGSSAGTTNVRYSNGCRYWTYNNGNYYWCGSGWSGLPGDPGPQSGGTTGGGTGFTPPGHKKHKH
ncbi:MAG TPA: transglycosylase domain-containing protein [Candidatus Dormibacteraeota bacterium]|nr:transglycosylase domain-containing protein [Candidatus Dormibacteraeota bacterium]